MAVCPAELQDQGGHPDRPVRRVHLEEGLPHLVLPAADPRAVVLPDRLVPVDLMARDLRLGRQDRSRFQSS